MVLTGGRDVVRAWFGSVLFPLCHLLEPRGNVFGLQLLAKLCVDSILNKLFYCRVLESSFHRIP